MQLLSWSAPVVDGVHLGGGVGVDVGVGVGAGQAVGTSSIATDCRSCGAGGVGISSVATSTATTDCCSCWTVEHAPVCQCGSVSVTRAMLSVAGRRQHLHRHCSTKPQLMQLPPWSAAVVDMTVSVSVSMSADCHHRLPQLWVDI